MAGNHVEDSLSRPAASGKKGDWDLLCAASEGPFRQKVPVPFFPAAALLAVASTRYPLKKPLRRVSAPKPRAARRAGAVRLRRRPKSSPQLFRIRKGVEQWKNGKNSSRSIPILSCDKALAGRTQSMSRRIVPAGVPGMAAADTPDPAAGPANRAVFPHRLDKIGTATRLEPATLPQHGTNRPLVHANRADQQQGGNFGQRSQDPVQAIHGFLAFQFSAHAIGGRDQRLAQ
jgi:hypothetical protein